MKIAFVLGGGGRWGAVEVGMLRALDESGIRPDLILGTSIGALMQAGVVKLKRVAQDGTRVRASAGAASFRRERSLRKCLKQAQDQVRALKRQLDAEDDQTTDRRRQAARERAARDRQQRVEEALLALEEVRESRKKNGKRSEPRASTTDPEARQMKMPDGGYRPAYNVQLAADTGHQAIVGVAVSSSGSDMAQAPAMVAQVRERLGLPVIVKAARGGSSLRLIVAHDVHELERAVEEARTFDAAMTASDLARLIAGLTRIVRDIGLAEDLAAVGLYVARDELH